MRHWIHFGTGSAIVYVAMAACSGQNPSRQQAGPQRPAAGGMASNAGGAEAVAAAGSGAAASGGDAPAMGGVMGAIVDPVPDAGAQEPPIPTPPTTNDVPCDKTRQSDPYTFVYAEQAYPGATAAELASVVALAHQLPEPPAGWVLPEGYEFRQVNTYVRDGAVGAYCHLASQPATYDFVRFVKP